MRLRDALSPHDAAAAHTRKLPGKLAISSLALLLAACSDDGGHADATQAAAPPSRESALATTRSPVFDQGMYPKATFTALEEVSFVFPKLLGNAGPVQTQGVYSYRHDSSSGNYAAITDLDFVAMGPWVGSPNSPVTVAAIEDFCNAGQSPRLCGFKHPLTVQVDGLERRFIVYVPWKARSLSKPPAVFMLHGTTGTGEEFYSRSGWREKADETGLIAVFPTALRHCLYEDDITINGIFDPDERRTPTKWAFGGLGDPTKMPLCTPAQRATLPAEALAAVDHPLADDLAFFDRMISVLVQNFGVERRRIYASGFSNGGQMVARLMAERSTVFAALASSAGPVADGFATPAPRPMSYVYTVGELDDRYMGPFGGPLPLKDMGQNPFFVNNQVKPMADLLQLDETAYTFTSNLLYGKTIGLHEYRTSEAKPAANNRLYVGIIEGMTHQYPNGDNHPLRMADVLWEFFKPLSLP